MRDPRINPQAGDRLAKITVNSRNVSMVISRTVLKVENSTVTYRKRRQPCKCALKDWIIWARNCKLPEK